jgi:hypothetical protein
MSFPVQLVEVREDGWTSAALLIDGKDTGCRLFAELTCLEVPSSGKAH